MWRCLTKNSRLRNPIFLSNNIVNETGCFGSEGRFWRDGRGIGLGRLRACAKSWLSGETRKTDGREGSQSVLLVNWSVTICPKRLHIVQRTPWAWLKCWRVSQSKKVLKGNRRPQMPKYRAKHGNLDELCRLIDHLYMLDCAFQYYPDPGEANLAEETE